MARRGFVRCPWIDWASSCVQAEAYTTKAACIGALVASRLAVARPTSTVAAILDALDVGIDGDPVE